MRDLSREESDRRAAAGEPFALRFRVPHDRAGHVQFTDAVYGDQGSLYVGTPETVARKIAATVKALGVARFDMKYSAGALAQTRVVVEGLQVDAAQMRANLDLTHGTIVSEAVMMGLGPYLGRQRAHDLVYDICREATTSRTPLVELLARNPEISKHLSRIELERMVDPAHYLGLAGEMVDRVLAIEQQAKA